MSDTVKYFGFGRETPKPAAAVAHSLAAAMFRLINAGDALREAVARVPRYTGQWSPEDYYAEEQEEYNRAADGFAAAVRNVIAGETE